jgi:glutamate racemase
VSNNPIGVFDSGVGGLSVWREIKKALPRESLIYYGDGLNCPYGSLPRERVAELTVEAVGWLARQGAKMAVVACNTATAAALDTLRERFEMPIVGMVPAVKPAAESTRTGVVAILATERALEGGRLKQYTADFAAGVEVIGAVGEGFVELVEQGLEESEQAVEAVGRVVEPLVAQGVDRLVLGCTHYPFLAGAIRRVVGARAVEIIDPAPAIARRVAQLLSEHGIAAEEGHVAQYQFHTLGGEEYLQKIRRRSATE